QTEFDGELWFFADRFSQLAKDIQHTPKVNLGFSDTSSNSYLSASGHAELVIDKVKAKELWNPAYKVWFQQG
ncbi:pyridoxamine 5'-phosphate oxidase family protein, partial [Vibrio parahaemolyticus]